MQNVMKGKTARKKATQSSKVGDGCWANNSAMEKMWPRYGITQYRSTKWHGLNTNKQRTVDNNIYQHVYEPEATQYSACCCRSIFLSLLNSSRATINLLPSLRKIQP